MLVLHELLWAIEGWTWRWGLLVAYWDGGGGLVGGLLLAMVAGVGCWGNGGIEGRWRCWCIVSCGGQLLRGCWDGLPS